MEVDELDGEVVGMRSVVADCEGELSWGCAESEAEAEAEAGSVIPSDCKNESSGSDVLASLRDM